MIDTSFTRTYFKTRIDSSCVRQNADFPNIRPHSGECSYGLKIWFGVIGILAFATIHASAQTRSHYVFDDANGQEIERRLEERIDFDFVEAPLEEALEHITKASDIRCWICKSALDAVGIGADSPVTFRGQGTRIRDGLRLMLEEHELTWTIKHGRLIITTPEAAEQDLITKVYDIKRVVRADWVPDWRIPPGATEVPYALQYDFDAVIEIVTTTIAPTTWDEVGGPGSITGYDGRTGPALVVSQTYEVHEELGNLLIKLEKFGGHPAPPATPPTPISVPAGLHTSRPANNWLWKQNVMRSLQLRTTGW
jgi:hypothetical protein